RRHSQGEGDGSREQIPFDYLVNNTRGERVPGRHWLSESAHFDRLGNAGEPRQALRPFTAANDAHPNLGLAEVRRRTRNAIMARHRSFKPSTVRRAVNGCDNGLGTIFEIVDGRQDGVETAWFSVVDLFKLPNVRTGDEGTAAADQHYR